MSTNDQNSASAAAPAPEAGDLATLVHDQSPEVLRAAASDRRMTEDLALTLLNRRDLPGQVIEDLSRNQSVMKHRKVINAVVAHLKTPRHVAIPIIKRLFTFELMHVALAPVVAADIKKVAEDALVLRMETISSGERLTLAKRASGGVAAALLRDPERRIIEAALSNPQMTEASIIRAVAREDSPGALVDLVCNHPKWSLRRDIRLALLRNEKISMAKAIFFAQSLPSVALRDVLHHSRLNPRVREYLLRVLEERPQGIKG
ncbi:MAG: hypothetical protein L0Z53_12385 [Acidobacteriales bacterium]|nr:hypothetical protein [Terriglobales bacterium]